MTDYKPGDRVKVEFEATITNWGDRWLEFDNGESVYRENVTITRIKPLVPTEFGSVVELEGVGRLVFGGQAELHRDPGGNLMTTLEELNNAGHGAVVAHPTDFEWLPFVKMEESWFELGPGCEPFPVDVNVVQTYIAFDGFQLLYSGVKR